MKPYDQFHLFGPIEIFIGKEYLTNNSLFEKKFNIQEEDFKRIYGNLSVF